MNIYVNNKLRVKTLSPLLQTKQEEEAEKKAAGILPAGGTYTPRNAPFILVDNIDEADVVIRYSTEDYIDTKKKVYEVKDDANLVELLSSLTDQQKLAKDRPFAKKDPDDSKNVTKNDVAPDPTDSDSNTDVEEE